MCELENEKLLSKIVELLRVERACNGMDDKQIKELASLAEFLADPGPIEMRALHKQLKDGLKAEFKRRYPGINLQRVMSKIIRKLEPELDRRTRAGQEQKNALLKKEYKQLEGEWTCLARLELEPAVVGYLHTTLPDAKDVVALRALVDSSAVQVKEVLLVYDKDYCERLSKFDRIGSDAGYHLLVEKEEPLRVRSIWIFYTAAAEKHAVLWIEGKGDRS